jgi:hypothetical protein
VFYFVALETQKSVKRFNLHPISWIDENEEEHSYYPDFIINDFTIVEVKSLHKLYGLHDNDRIIVEKNMKP